MRFASALFLLGVIASTASAQMDTTIAVELRASDRAAVEKAACGKSGKRALGIQGHRSFLRRDHEMTATVLCEDAVENDTFRAYFPRNCTKKGAHWKCSEPGIRLHIDVAGGGPYEIQVDELSLDEALVGIQCLDAVFAQNPQILNGPKRGRVSALYAGEPQRSRPFVAYVETANECFWLEYPRQCRAGGAEPVQVTVTTGCIDE
jgi:hypothetical protein